MKPVKHALGNNAEKLACTHLQNNGLKLITKNYRCRMGEIDLIMQDKQQTVFVEVRYRHTANFGTAEETVTTYKQQKIIKAASHYLLAKNLYDKVACRFDVVAIAGKQNINWIKSAFTKI